MNHIRLNFSSLSAVYLTVIFAAIMVFAAPLQSLAQAEEAPKKEFRFADADLLKFFDANQELSVLQRETQERINAAIESHGLTMDRFNQIVRAAQIGALDGGLYSDEEIEAYNTAAPEVTNIQRDMQAMLQATLIEVGLSSDLYQEIMAEFRSDSELQNHVRELLRERARQAAREARQREREQNQEQE